MRRRSLSCARSTRSTPTTPHAWKGERGPRGLRGMAAARRMRPRQAQAARRAAARDEAIHPMLRALWAPRLLEAIDWIAAAGARKPGRRAGARSRPRSTARRLLAGVTGAWPRRPHRPACRTAALAIIDYKTGAAADAEGGRCGFRAAARPARADRPRRRLRRRVAAIRRRSNIGRWRATAATSAG